MTETPHPSYEFTYDPSSQVREWPDPLPLKLAKALGSIADRSGRAIWSGLAAVAENEIARRAGAFVGGVVVVLPLVAAGICLLTILVPLMLIYGLVVDTAATVAIVVGYSCAAAAVAFVFKALTGGF